MLCSSSRLFTFNSVLKALFCVSNMASVFSNTLSSFRLFDPTRHSCRTPPFTCPRCIVPGIATAQGRCRSLVHYGLIYYQPKLTLNHPRFNCRALSINKWFYIILICGIIVFNAFFLWTVYGLYAYWLTLFYILRFMSLMFRPILLKSNIVLWFDWLIDWSLLST